MKHSPLYFYTLYVDIIREVIFSRHFARLLFRGFIISQMGFNFDIPRSTCMFSTHLPATSRIHIFANRDLIGKTRKFLLANLKTFKVYIQGIIVHVCAYLDCLYTRPKKTDRRIVNTQVNRVSFGCILDHRV